MKKSVSPRMVACLVLGLIAPLSAQNLVSNPSPPEDSSKWVRAQSALPGTYVVPATERAQGEVSDAPAIFTAQDAITLDARMEVARKVDSVVDLDVLRNPSPYVKIPASAKGQPYEISEDGLQTGLALISAIYRESGKSENSGDCSTIALSVEQRIKLNPSRILEIVESEIGANPACACEVVKTAIKASDANADEVVAIVETAIHAAPESMRIVSQCAIAAMPEAIAGVQALLAKLDPNAGETGDSAKSSKSAKSAKNGEVASITAPPAGNPLDRPFISFPPLPPVIPPLVTDVNPQGPVF